MRHPLRLLSIVLVTLFIVAAVSLGPLPGALAASRTDAGTSLVALGFGDRKTSSYTSMQLVSYLRGTLESRGWITETQAYSSLVKSGTGAAQNTSFMQVSGENVLAYRMVPSAADPVDLLLVAPYDNLFPDEPGNVSYTARATEALLSFACSLEASQSGPGFQNVVVAFVSGHYQYGAGINALLDELITKRGATVEAAIAIGDIDALDSLPIALSGKSPVSLAAAVHLSAKKSFTPATLVGPTSRSAWYRAVMSPQAGAFSTESLVDGGRFTGEASALLERGIPALTIGTPRNNLPVPPSTASGNKVEQVGMILTSFLAAGMPAALAGGPVLEDMVAVQAFGEAYFLPARTLLAAAVVVVLVALVLIARHARRANDLTPLALLGGVTLAMVAAHFFRSAWFSGDPQKYFLALRPYETVFLYVWSGLGLVAMGFFRIWRIRTRIALLHSRIPSPAAPPIGGESEIEGQPAALPAPTGAAGNWAGPWGLAVVAAVLLGTSAVRSEISPFALVSTLGLALAVLCDRPDRFPKPATLLLRLLGAAAILPTLLWAGSPLSLDAARVYALSISRISVEAVAFTASISAFVACLVSSFRLPPPASRGKMALVALAEISIVAIFIAVGMLIPRHKAETLPARAVVREYLGSEARITIDATRPLGNLVLMPDGVRPTIQEVPAGLISRTRSEVVRLGLKVPTTWADISQATVSTEKGEKATTVSATLTATFRERPAFFQLTLQDVALTKNSTTAFVLEDLPGLIAGDGESPDISVEPRVGYAVIVTWWMPVEGSLTRDFTLAIVPTSSRVDVTGRAVYLGRSYLGLAPSAANATFNMITSVTGLTTYR